jgi:hypothetical protein
MPIASQEITRDMETERSLQRSQHLAARPCPEPEKVTFEIGSLVKRHGRCCWRFRKLPPNVKCSYRYVEQYRIIIRRPLFSFVPLPETFPHQNCVPISCFSHTERTIISVATLYCIASVQYIFVNNEIKRKWTWPNLEYHLGIYFENWGIAWNLL